MEQTRRVASGMLIQDVLLLHGTTSTPILMNRLLHQDPALRFENICPSALLCWLDTNDTGSSFTMDFRGLDLDYCPKV